MKSVCGNHYTISEAGHIGGYHLLVGCFFVSFFCVSMQGFSFCSYRFVHSLLVVVCASVCVVVLSSCAATSLLPGAEQVRIVTKEPADCEYLGEVIGEQGGAFTGGATSNVNLEQGALNDMKNKAFKMGGTIVVLMTTRAGQTGSLFDGSIQQTNVVYVGTVYRCK